MRYLLLIVLLLGLGSGSCSSYRHGHRATIHYYRRQERKHTRERRRTQLPSVMWSKL
jgi:hypothetical protein